MEQRFEIPVKKPQHSKLCTPYKAKKISFQTVRGAFFFKPGCFRSENCNFMDPESIWVTFGILLFDLGKSVCVEGFFFFFFFRCVVIVIAFSKIIQSFSKSKGSCKAIAFLIRQHDLHLSLLPPYL